MNIQTTGISQIAGYLFDNKSLQTVTLTNANLGPSTTISTANYGSISFELLGAWSGAIIVEGSNTGTTWENIPLPVFTETGSSVDVITGPGLYTCVPITAYLRLNIKAVVGSIVATIVGKAEAISPLSLLNSQYLEQLLGSMVNGVASTNISDGLQVAKLTYGDQNGLSTSIISKSGTFIASGTQAINSAMLDSNTGLFYVDASQYNSITICPTSYGTGVTSIVFQGSVNGSTWINCYAARLDIPNVSPSVSATSVSTAYMLPAGYRYYRLILGAAQTAGITLVSYVAKATPNIPIQYSSAAVPTFTVPSVSTGNGLTSVYQNGALSNTAIAVKASLGNLYGYTIYNPNATAVTVELFNTGTITLGTTVPLWHLTLPATASAHAYLPFPISFGTAIYVVAVTAYNGSTAPTTGVDVCIIYN